MTETVVPSINYTLDASAQTITLTSPYDAVTVEQVNKIRNLSKNMLIYDSSNPGANIADDNETGISIGISEGVISFDYDATMADTDKLQIIVDTV